MLVSQLKKIFQQKKKKGVGNQKKNFKLNATMCDLNIIKSSRRYRVQYYKLIIQVQISVSEHL